jgi:hypothetical protein
MEQRLGFGILRLRAAGLSSPLRPIVRLLPTSTLSLIPSRDAGSGAKYAKRIYGQLLPGAARNDEPNEPLIDQHRTA